MIVAGFGFRRSATVESLADALEIAGADKTITALATADDKASAAPFRGLADRLGLPVLAIDAETLETQQTITRSAVSQAARATGSLSEAAALAAAGVGAQLIAPRTVSRDGLATCALARGKIA
ncbi:MAG: cobalamin biosynthesis protein [Pseudomonadota bacterium]